VTLWRLISATDVQDALNRARSSTPRRFETHMAQADGMPVALFEGDAGYEDHNPSRPGPRHRLLMTPDGWRFEDTEGT
jgi:hypothetical protein